MSFCERLIALFSFSDKLSVVFEESAPDRPVDGGFEGVTNAAAGARVAEATSGGADSVFTRPPLAPHRGEQVRD